MGAKKPHEQQPGQTKMCCFPSLWHLFANRSVFLGHCACVFQTNRGCLCPSPSLSQAPSLASTGLDACLCPLISALAPHPCRLSSLSTQRGREGRMGVWRLCTEAWGHTTVRQAGSVCLSQPQKPASQIWGLSALGSRGQAQSL